MSLASQFDVTYYTKAAIAGGICCGVTHGALTPVDVIKTRIQLDPVKYSKGMGSAFKTVVATEGSGALLTGLGATASGYFVQGWFKFGGVEFFKIQLASRLGEEKVRCCVLFVVAFPLLVSAVFVVCCVLCVIFCAICILVLTDFIC